MSVVLAPVFLEEIEFSVHAQHYQFVNFVSPNKSWCAAPVATNAPTAA